MGKDKVTHLRKVAGPTGPTMNELLFMLTSYVYEESKYGVRLVLSTPERLKSDPLRLEKYDDVNISTSGIVISSTKNHPFVQAAGDEIIKRYGGKGDGIVELAAVRSTGAGATFYTLMLRFIPSFRQEYLVLTDLFLRLFGSFGIFREKIREMIGDKEENSGEPYDGLRKSLGDADCFSEEVQAAVEDSGAIDDVEGQLEALIDES